MRRTLTLALTAGALAALLLVPLVQADDRARTAQDRGPGVHGTFSLQAMMHTATEQFPTLPGVAPWNGRSVQGRFGYRSIPCFGNAPVNNISTNLPSYNGRVAGSRNPVSTRLHPFRFEVERTRRGLQMQGSITMTVCHLRSGPTANPDPIADEDKPKIRFTFRALATRQNVEELHFDGRFRITGGTQRYDDLTGSGRIAGYLFCFNPAGCGAQATRQYLDGQISMQGRYADRTPELAEG